MFELLAKIVERGLLKPGPVKIMEGGLAAVPAGLKYMLDGKVSGEKLTYRISDTPRV